MRRIKILFAIDCLIWGGTELQVAGLIRRLDPSRYEPYLLTIRPTDAVFVPAGCRHLAWDVPRLFSLTGLRSLRELVRLLRAEKIDIVQTYFQDSTIMAGLAAFVARVPVRVASFRDMAFWGTSRQRLAMRVGYRFMNSFTCNASVLRSLYAQLFGLDTDAITLIENGVDENVLPFVAHDGPVTDVVIVGNMSRQTKRTDLFLRSAALVARSFPNVRWHVVGDGSLRPNLEALARDLGIAAQVRFAGRVTDVPGYLRCAQVGVLCSDTEGLSNALIEYMFMGAVPVVTAVGGNLDLVTDGTNGLVVEPGSAEQLAAAIEVLIRDNALRARLAVAARRYVEARFSWQKCLDQYDRYYCTRLQIFGRTPCA